MTLQPGRAYRMDEVAETPSPYVTKDGAYCHHPNREAAEGQMFGRAYLLERCTDCPKQWPVRPISRKRRDQLRSAQRRALG